MLSISFQARVGAKLASWGHAHVILDVAAQRDSDEMQNDSANNP